jgi:7-cyano-7-deazaguanine synthase in queuosine biosynthesis
MPGNEHLVLCGGSQPRQERGKRLDLNLHGRSPNVRLQIEDISSRLLARLPDVHVDLLEIASYVYAADSATYRGGRSDAQMGKRWRRSFHFVIPVRLPELWSSKSVTSALVETLCFLSDDQYKFEFRRLDDPPELATYFEFPDSGEAAFTPDEVILFSGGLDSFSGTVEEIVANGKKVALVSHRSAAKIASAQKHLVEDLKRRFGGDRVLHVPIWANLTVGTTKEPTHRTRSFLFAAIGAVTARLFGRDRIRFFENGVVSLNLPPIAQVVGARATRTTHPQALAGFRWLFAEILDRPFEVDNPFAWLTKHDVVERIATHGCADLIRHTRSCTRVHDMTKLHPHCGQCSQCIDRRFGVLAAGQEDEDPAEAYKVDLFEGSRRAGPDREMALAYVRSASRIQQLEDVAFFAQYGEVSRIIDYFAESADAVAERILDLHRRHAAGVCGVFDDAISAHASALREGNLATDCLLSLVVGQHGAADSYPQPSEDSGEVAAIDTDIRIAVDQTGKRVVFDRWGEIRGVGAELLIALAEPFRVAASEERAPQNYPFTQSGELRRQTKCDHEETFRRRVMRCREQIKTLAQNAGDPLPTTHAVIENLQRHGYRLNPDQVRIVALSEIRRSE